MRGSLDGTVRGMKDILAAGKNENIVGICDHGWKTNEYFGIDVDVYYIDMEYCDFTLEDYIKYHRDEFDLSIAIETVPVSNPVIIAKNCSALARVENTWTIGGHIALGLEYMHANGIVHKELKPSHGTLNLEIERLICSSLLPTRS
jgi:serine/threonine protein kinase